ncbi:helix-turn-helix domain-containing protein [Nocardia carnea]|uniref:helix-turn-helix domain-containing protein n=1 Tax=Nocardia carnea TaxID=37328 RepID=UPI002457E0BC|nr:helix-turn-helix transcriptional regulator [Nocardia carnea]
MDPEFGDVIEAIGPRLRELRRRNGTTLSALSEITGIPVSTLSRLESGQRKPSLELLLPLAKAHRVALDELVAAPETGDPRVNIRPINRHGQTLIPLTRKPGGLQAYKQILSGRESAEPQMHTHEGYHWLYVLNGRLRLILGDRDMVLTPGEVAEFDTHLPHWFGNADEHPVEYLSLFGPQGERFHIKARYRPS